MGQTDVICALFIFLSLIFMQRAFKISNYFPSLLLGYLALGVSMQFKTYGGLLLPVYIVYTIALVRDRKIEIRKSLSTLGLCLATLLVAMFIVWAPYFGWFTTALSHGESNWLLQYPSSLVKTVAPIWVRGYAPIWVIGYAFILCYLAVNVLKNTKRALEDNRYFIFYNFAIVAWFFIAVFTHPQWWMFLIPVALLALDNSQNKKGVLFCVTILAIYPLYPLYWFDYGVFFVGYHPRGTQGWNQLVLVLTILALFLFFLVLELKRELRNAERHSTSAR